MVLIYPGKLPPGALLSAEGAAARPAPPPAPPPPRPDPAPVWFRADQGIALNPAGRLAEWQAQDGAAARPVVYNDEGNEVVAGRAVCFSHRSHNGLVVEAASPAEAVTLGLILSRERRDPETVAALQVTGEDGYTFLSVDGGEVRLGQKGGEAGLSLPDPGGVMLLMLSVGAGVAALSVNGGATKETALSLSPGLVRLFFGCRGDARALTNKMGPFRLSDALLWPGQALLAEGVSGRAMLPVIRLWQERQRHGL